MYTTFGCFLLFMSIALVIDEVCSVECHICEYMGGISTDNNISQSIHHMSTGSHHCLAMSDNHLKKCTGGHTGCGTIFMETNISYQKNGMLHELTIQNIVRACQFLIEDQEARCWSLKQYDDILYNLTSGSFSITSMFLTVQEIEKNLGLESENHSTSAITGSPHPAIRTNPTSSAITGRVCQCFTGGCNKEHFKKATYTSVSTTVGEDQLKTDTKVAYSPSDTQNDRSSKKTVIIKTVKSAGSNHMCCFWYLYTVTAIVLLRFIFV